MYNENGFFTCAICLCFALNVWALSDGHFMHLATFARCQCEQFGRMLWHLFICSQLQSGAILELQLSQSTEISCNEVFYSMMLIYIYIYIGHLKARTDENHADDSYFLSLHVKIRQSDSIKVESYFSIKQHAIVNTTWKFNISLCFMFAYFFSGLFDC